MFGLCLALHLLIFIFVHVYLLYSVALIIFLFRFLIWVLLCFIEFCCEYSCLPCLKANQNNKKRKSDCVWTVFMFFMYIHKGESQPPESLKSWFWNALADSMFLSVDEAVAQWPKFLALLAASPVLCHIISRKVVLTLCWFHSLCTQSFRKVTEGADSVRLGEGDFRRRMHRDEVCPLSGVTDYGRV